MAKKKKFPVTRAVKEAIDALSQDGRLIDAQQLKSYLGVKTAVFLSWGTEAMSLTQNKRLAVLKVNGFKHKGIVAIKLNGADLFEVHLLNEDGSIKRSINDLYFDQLQSAIDEAIEHTGKDYEERVKESFSPNLSQFQTPSQKKQ